MRWLIFLFILCFHFSCFAKNPMDLRRYGDENAPVQMYLFTSLACPHCADFYQQILPKIQKEYVDTNQAYLTKVETIGDQNSLVAVALIRCQDSEFGEYLESAFYQQQGTLFSFGKTKKDILEFALKYGISQSDFDKCLAHRNLQEKILTQQNNLSELYHVERLPTLIVRSGERVLKLEGADKKNILTSLAEFFGK